MLKIKNKIPSALTIGGKIVERVLMRNEVVWGRVQTPLYIQNTYNGSNTVTVKQTLVGEPVSSTYAKHLQYSKNGLNWTTITLSSTAYTITLNKGEKVYFRGNEGVFNYWYSRGTKKAITTISANQTHTVGGNINTLLDYQDPYGLKLPQGAFCGIFENNTNLTSASDITLPPSVDGSLSSYCYLYLFRKCTNLTTVPKIIPAKIQGQDSCNGMFQNTAITTAPALPATILGNSCYVDTFHGCSKLVNPPALPAKTLKPSCYRALFARCTSLVNAPELPATTLADGCYRELFYGCTSLVNPPELPAETLTTSCYQQLFYGCSKLNNITVYANNISATNCITDWLSGVASKGTFNNYGGATYTANSPSGIPSGWTQNRDKTNYFYIESLGDGNTVTLITNLRNTSYSSYLTPTIEYSTDKQNWTTITFDWSTTDVKNINIPVVLNTGDKMYFRNDTGKFSRAIYDGGSYNTSYITFTTDLQGRVNVGGDIRTLINYRNVDNTILEDGMFSNLFSPTYDSNHNAARIVDASNLILPFTQMIPYCYYSMFYGCTPLVNAPALPATTLAWSCYQFMFRGCTSLTTAPTLPDTTLASSCYYGMFWGCTGLTTAPELPATTLASDCYERMFQDCTSLTSAPALPATTLAWSCYQWMFDGCTSLTIAPTLPATTLEISCYSGMFQGCTSLVNAPQLPAITLVSGCYSTMFQNCSKLTTAPALPATTLAGQCYESMFNGCSNLNKVLTYAEDISASDCTTNWLNNVASSGTLYNAGSAVYTTDSPSGIPTGWTEDTTVPGTTSVYALPNTFSAKSWMDNYKLNYTIMGVNEMGIDVPLGEQNELITIGKNTGSSTVTHTETLNYDGWDYTITINQTANDTDEPEYFYIESLGDGNTVSVINKGHIYTYNVTPTLEYSTDKNTWDTITFDWTNGNHTTELPIALNTGEKMYFRNDTRKFSDLYGTISFSSSVSSNVGGDIRTLSNYLDVDNERTVQSNMFRNLFYNNEYIVDASNLRLPYTTLAERCYQSMFQGCTSLVNAPALPATTLAYYCYWNMFRDCTSLTTAPALPVTTLAERCYNSMFYGCTSLTTAPELPATTLASLCYDSMFWSCTSLTTAPELPATTLANNCYSFMFNGCTSLTTAPALPATTLVNSCYERMFQNCTSLTTAPALPATTLESRCYSSMFSGCTSLTTAPALPATSLANYCYESMFQNCTSLTTAPELPATTIADSCYYSMFQGCTSLTTAPTLPATTLESWCYDIMFKGCTSLTTAPALPATTLASRCYSGMFQNCTSLTTVPELPATTIADTCYSSMFQGCNSLTSVTIYATSTANNSFDSWLDNVAPSGTVYNNGLLNLPKNSVSGIPIGWTEVLPPIQSITANPDTFTIKSYKDTVKCTSTLTITTTLGMTVTDTNTATFTVGENTGDTTRTLTETIPYKGSSYQVTIVQTANDVKPAYSWNVVSTGTYPFELNTNDYYESTNKGQKNSYSYATLNYEGFENLVLECINSGESNYDYGIISQPDVQLSESTSDDGATGSTNVFHNFKGQSSTNPVQLTIPSDKGSHFITIKFIKDVSGDSGNDSLQFKVIEP